MEENMPMVRPDIQKEISNFQYEYTQLLTYYYKYSGSFKSLPLITDLSSIIKYV